VGDAYNIKVDDLFAAWNTWCERQGRTHPGTKESFGRDLLAAIPRLKKTRPRGVAGREQCYEGVKLRLVLREAGPSWS
jgi:putative DNA primase/helicase